LDEKDIIKALDVFLSKILLMVLSIDEFIDFINAEYLLSPRQQLTKNYIKNDRNKICKVVFDKQT